LLQVGWKVSGEPSRCSDDVWSDQPYPADEELVSRLL
jgi:hypothetical protein